ncbi:oxidoreductase [Leisingera sp. ANG-M1]|uniref:molybdopterin-dependent oxidoreductase n=1 Tax=Leisingera sp. ANG-M1 TaxID=1577895 RepID=UPI00057FE1A1|nr:molybdopterin-dependent oxidoreductase [Leisingera sp. ANG-M1]KIC11146.1 oxidoreductase [Leisingera sp. ANG-M1]
MRGLISRAAALAFAVVTACAAMVSASEDQPVLLSVRLADGGAPAEQYTIDDLRSLAPVTFETETIWTSGPQQFTGVPLAVLMERMGVSSGQLEAHAVNDYSVQIPVSDAVAGGPIVAYERNGAEMSLRNKGPLWVVYPYDSNPAYRTEEVYSRSIWQLDRIVIRQ